LLVAIQDDEVVSCICLEKEEDQAYIGLFSVHPKLQRKGVGKSILSKAEEYAFSTLHVRRQLLCPVGDN